MVHSMLIHVASDIYLIILNIMFQKHSSYTEYMLRSAP